MNKLLHGAPCRPRLSSRWLALVGTSLSGMLLISMLTACGQSGPLYSPQPSEDIAHEATASEAIQATQDARAVQAVQTVIAN